MLVIKLRQMWSALLQHNSSPGLYCLSLLIIETVNSTAGVATLLHISDSSSLVIV